MHRLWIAIVFVFACGASFVVGHAWQQQPAANRGSLKLLLGHTQLGVDTLAMGNAAIPRITPPLNTRTNRSKSSMSWRGHTGT